MPQNTTHNPDQYMSDLREILAQGKKRVGLLVGAGAPFSIKLNDNGDLDIDGKPLIPNVATLTEMVISQLKSKDKQVVNKIIELLEPLPNIEAILTRIRRLSQAIGTIKVHGLDGPEFEELAKRICEKIGEYVNASLPKASNPYTELSAWIGGIHRDHPVEIFTPNYDLLFEQALEKAHLPFFDGFSGAYKPFFDATSITSDTMPPSWTRLWKLHGSLGWDVQNGTVIRTGEMSATQLIYPDHLKYDQINKQPYTALFERLKNFLLTPDSLLICTGFSFFDAHITSVLDEAAAANAHTAIFAFQYGKLEDEAYAVDFGIKRSNVSVYAQDGAVIFGNRGAWLPGEPLSADWTNIRKTFLEAVDESSEHKFLLGDFSKLARFFALSQASEFTSTANLPTALAPSSMKIEPVEASVKTTGDNDD